jgi:hypothetical protein
MNVITGEEAAELNALAETMGLRYQVRLSTELSELLNPNSFMKGLGISYSERLKTIFGILRGTMVPGNGGVKETMPKGGTVIPLTIAQGPFIREELISLRAELSDDDGKAEILLTAILAQE